MPAMQPLTQHAIVEGEPGIFPAPVASLMRKIGGFFDRKPKSEHAPPPSPDDDTSESRPPKDDTTPKREQA
jgi:hypothetical protein